MCRPRCPMLLNARTPPLRARLPRWAEGCALQAQAPPGHVGRDIVVTSYYLVSSSCATVQNLADRIGLCVALLAVLKGARRGELCIESTHPNLYHSEARLPPVSCHLWCRTTALGSPMRGCSAPPYLPAQWRLPPRTLFSWRA